MLGPNVSKEQLEQQIEILGAQIEANVIALKKVAKKCDKNGVIHALQLGLGGDIIKPENLKKLENMSNENEQELFNSIASIIKLRSEMIITFLTLEGVSQRDEPKGEENE